MAAPQLASKFDQARSALGATAAIVVLSAMATFGTATGAQAQEASVQPASTGSEIQITSLSDVADLMEEAGNYGASGEGIGALVIIGNSLVDRGLTADQAGQIVIGLLEEHGATGKAYVGYNGEDASAITLFTKNDSFGPYNVDGILENAQLAAEEFKSEQTVALSQLDLN